MKKKEASCKVGAVAQSEPSETREDVQGRAWRQHYKIRSLDLEGVDEAEASFDTMEGIQEAGHLAEAAESGDEGVQCTPSEFGSRGGDGTEFSCWKAFWYQKAPYFFV